MRRRRFAPGRGDWNMRAKLTAFAAVLVFSAALVSGSRAAVHSLAMSFRFGPRATIPGKVEVAAHQVDRMVPPGEPILYVTAGKDTWICGIWQRLLYQRTVACARGESPRFQQDVRDAEARLHPRWVVADPQVAGKLRWETRATLPSGVVLGTCAP